LRLARYLGDRARSGQDLSGLIELLFVVGLLFWFWESQTASPRRGEEGNQGKEHRPPPGDGAAPPPAT